MTQTTSPLTSDEKLWVILCHISALLGVGFVLPLIVYLVKKDDSETIGYHAKEALNFHISLFLYALVCVPLTMVLIGVPMLMLLGLAGIILAIVATIKGSEGVRYRYPYILRIIS